MTATLSTENIVGNALPLAGRAARLVRFAQSILYPPVIVSSAIAAEASIWCAALQASYQICAARFARYQAGKGGAAGFASDSWQGIPRGPESVALPVGWLVVVARASASLHVALRPHSGLARFASLATRAPGAMSGGDL